MDILYNHQTYIIAYGEALFPSEDLYPSEDLFPSEEYTIYNKFVSGSLVLSEVIADGNIEFGVPIANRFECTIYDETNIGQEDVDVYQVIDGVSVPIFSGKIDSAKLDKSGVYRKLIAYDAFYWYSTINIAGWWESFWVDRDTATLRDIRKSLVSYIGLIEADKDQILVNDNIDYFKKTISISNMTFKDMFKMILELSGVIPNINRMGLLEYITLSNNASDISDKYETDTSEFQAYTTGNITGIHFTDSTGESKRLIGNDFNAYTIASNIFIFEMSTEQLDTVGTNLLNAVKDITYVPSDINMIVSDFNYHVGDRIQTEQGSTYILEQLFSGVQLVEQNIISSGDEILPQVKNSADPSVQILGEKVAKFNVDLEGLTSEFSDFAQQTNSKFIQTAESITTEVNRATSAENGLRQDYTSRIEQTSESITSTVAKTQNIWDEEDLNIKYKDYAQPKNTYTLEEFEQLDFDDGDLYLDVDTGTVYRGTVSGATDTSVSVNWVVVKTLQKAQEKLETEIIQTSESISSSASKSSKTWVEENPSTHQAITIDYYGYGQPPTTPDSSLDIADAELDNLYLDGEDGKVYKVTNIEYEQVIHGQQIIIIKHFTWTYQYTLQARVAELSSRIEQTAESITTEVNRATSAENGLRQDYTSRIEQTSESITSTVAEATSKYDESSLAESHVTLTKRGYGQPTDVSDVPYLDQETGNVWQYNSTRGFFIWRTLPLITTELESRIEQTVSGITFSLSKQGEDTAVLSITYTKEDGSVIQLAAQNIQFTGLVEFSDLSGNGTTTINGANIKTGTISADRLDVTGIFAKNVTATGTISGATLSGADITTNGSLKMQNALGDTDVMYVDYEGTVNPVCLVINAIPFTSGLKIYGGSGGVNIVNSTLNLLTRGVSGIYSPHILNYLLREYQPNPPSGEFYTALGNNSQGTRIYGSSIWAAKSIDIGSDERIKDDYEDLSRFEELFYKLNPCSYTFKYDSEKRHVGFKAQQVEATLNEDENLSDKYSFVHINEPDEEIKEYISDGRLYTLCYDEFIALNTHMIQKQHDEIEELKNEIQELKTIINKLIQGGNE